MLSPALQNLPLHIPCSHRLLEHYVSIYWKFSGRNQRRWNWFQSSPSALTCRTTPKFVKKPHQDPSGTLTAWATPGNTQPSPWPHLQLPWTAAVRTKTGKKREKTSAHPSGCFQKKARICGGIYPALKAKVTWDMAPFFHWKPDAWSTKLLSKNDFSIKLWSNVVSTNLPF